MESLQTSVKLSAAYSGLLEINSLEYAQAVDNISVFSNIDSNLKQYEGLIYDGAYSDHVNKAEKVGLVGNVLVCEFK